MLKRVGVCSLLALFLIVAARGRTSFHYLPLSPFCPPPRRCPNFVICVSQPTCSVLITVSSMVNKYPGGEIFPSALLHLHKSPSTHTHTHRGRAWQRSWLHCKYGRFSPHAQTLTLHSILHTNTHTGKYWTYKKQDFLKWVWVWKIMFE